MWSFFSRDAAKDFPYEILEQVNGTEEFLLWKLHKGKKKVFQLISSQKKNRSISLIIFYFLFHKGKTDEFVSIFILDAKTGGNNTQLEIAKSAVKRLKTLRHPNILTYIDSLEVMNSIQYFDFLISIRGFDFSPTDRELCIFSDRECRTSFFQSK